jgi:hypothetical protein
MSIYIQLFHGRHTADEELDDWGFDGPVLGPFPWFHVTYGDDIKLGDDGICVAGKEIVLPVPDSEGFIAFLGAYYGDISVTSEDTIMNSPDLKKKWKRTQEAFLIMGNDFGKYINDPEEWIRHYAICKLGGKL